MSTAVQSTRAAELEPFLDKIEKRHSFLLQIRRLTRQRAELVRQLAELDVELAMQAEPLRQLLKEFRPPRD